MSNSKWIVKKLTPDGWVIISEHKTEQDARSFWEGGALKGEPELVFEEKGKVDNIL